ncbi:MAG: DNA gyrase subunit A, partial [Clostridia bacterium]|nr:DNA gyrase subunit A [Clostridia bacterium]
YTQLQVSYGIIMLALVDGVPRILTLKDVLSLYIKHQEEVIVRRTRFDLKKAQERAHILEGLMIALDFIDEVIAILRASKDQTTGKQALIERFGLDEIQADAIVKMRLGQLTGLERTKIEEELAALKEKIKEFNEILASEGKVLEIIKTEAMAIRDKFADDRRTEIAQVSGEVDIEDLIPEEQCVYTLTKFGYIKRQPTETYSIQNRGGRGVKGMTTREEDTTQTMFTCSSHDFIMFFTTKGKVYRLKGYEIPEGSRQSKGMNIVNLLPLEGDEKISSMIKVPDFGGEEIKYLCMVTRKGIIKRTDLEQYKNLRKNGIIAINLDDDDELAWTRLTDGNDDILVATRCGMSIRFNENDCRPIGRTARGVKAIELKEGDEVIGMCVIRENDDGKSKIMTIAETGLGRRSETEEYRVQTRAGKGVLNYHIEKYGIVAAVDMVNDDDDVILIASNGIIIRIAAEQINTVSRTSKGVRVMRIGEEDKVVSAIAVQKEETDEASEGETEENTEATE